MAVYFTKQKHKSRGPRGLYKREGNGSAAMSLESRTNATESQEFECKIRVTCFSAVLCSSAQVRALFYIPYLYFSRCNTESARVHD